MTRITGIIDCDPGVDDSMAILLALGSPELDLQAITLVLGNSPDMTLMGDNACRLLNRCGVTHVPVVKGCTEPLNGRGYHGQSGQLVHGADAQGNLFERPCTEAERAPLRLHMYRDAADCIIQHCLAAPGTITLVTLGPLTNIATALRRAPGLAAAVKAVYMMGGAFHGRGNKGPATEANIGNDPEAAQEVFRQLAGKITVAHLGLTHQLSLAELLSRLRRLNTAATRYIDRITRHYEGILTKWGETPVPIHDSTAVLALLRPDLFTCETRYVMVETQGEFTRGMTVADWWNHYGRAPADGTQILQGFMEGGMEEYYQDFVRRIAQCPYVEQVEEVEQTDILLKI